MNKKMRLEDRTAVVTGAASGIGRALAQALGRRRCRLALADLDERGLERTAELIAAPGRRVSCHRLDVADAQAVARFPDEVRAVHPGVDLLLNSAGVALAGTFEQASDADFNWLFEINFWGVVRMTHAFLPLLQASDDARLVNLSSVFGLIGAPGQVAYSTSKFAVRGFSEALRHELAESPVGVTVAHPGGVATAIADKARRQAGTSAAEAAQRRAAANRLLKTPPEDAAEAVVRGVERRKPRVLVGSDAKAVALIVRFMPVSYWRVVKRFFPN